MGIHRVVPDDESLALETRRQRGPSWPEDLCSKNIFLFDSYVAVAEVLHINFPELVSLEQLRDVTKGAMQDFERLAITHRRWTKSTAGCAARETLKGDVCKVSNLLIRAGEEELEFDSICESRSRWAPKDARSDVRIRIGYISLSRI